MKLLVFVSVFITFAVSHAFAATVWNMAWQGDGGFKVEGTFSYEDAAASDGLVTKTELSSFVATAFDAGGGALATYDFVGGVTPAFLPNFEFEVATRSLLGELNMGVVSRRTRKTT